MTSTQQKVATTFGQLLAAGLLDRDEALSALYRAAAYPDDTAAIERALDDAALAHEAAITTRIRAMVAPLFAARACAAAIVAQARHANNCRGRINALPDAMVLALVDAEAAERMAKSGAGGKTAAAQEMKKERRRA